jgi:hypothetical protein
MEVLFYLLVGGVVLAISLYKKAQTREQWEQAANDLGLTFQSGFFTGAKLSGRYNAAPIEVYKVTRGGKNNRRTYTVFEVGLPPRAPGNLVIADEGLLAGIGKFMGMQDIEVGDSIFDDAFVIKGQNPAAVKRFLSQDNVTDQILELSNKYPNRFEIKDGKITVEVRGAAPSFEIEMALDDLTRCIDAMRGKDVTDPKNQNGPTRSGPFGGFPEQAAAASSQPGPPPEPDPSGGERFGPAPAQNAPPPDAGPAQSRPENDRAEPTPEDQPDDWW